MFFRNLTLYRFSREVAADLARLDEALPDHRLRPCGPMDLFTRGFVPPVGRGEDAALTHTVQACTWFVMGGEEKLLPAAVVNDELHHRIQKIAEEEGRKVGGRERKRMKEDLLNELLPRAFVRASRTSAYVDIENLWLVIDTSSRKSTDLVLTQVREALGSFPALPLAPEEGPRVLMTDWLANGTLPAGLTLGDECELRDPGSNTGAIARCRRQDLESEELKEHMRNGKQVFQLGLVFDDRISFVLGEDLVLRKVKLLDVVLDELGDSAPDAAAELDARFALFTLEVQRLLDKLAEWFGLAVDAPLRLHRQDAPASMRVAEKALRTIEENATRGGYSVEISAKVAGGERESLVFIGDPARDPLLPKAIEHVRLTRRSSISSVQRHFRIGYNRAERLIEEMEKAGVVSAPGPNGARALIDPAPS
jgi:recombination associated protein RdgC